MNASGWIMLLLSCGTVLALSAFCFYKVFSLKDHNIEKELRAPLDIDTRDKDE